MCVLKHPFAIETSLHSTGVSIFLYLKHILNIPNHSQVKLTPFLDYYYTSKDGRRRGKSLLSLQLHRQKNREMSMPNNFPR
jgi:hypothetical protein